MDTLSRYEETVIVAIILFFIFYFYSFILFLFFYYFINTLIALRANAGEPLPVFARSGIDTVRTFRSYYVQLARRGLNVAILSRSKEKLDVVANQISESHGSIE